MKSQKGFTLIELMLVIGITVILVSFSTINLLKVSRNTSLSEASEALIQDLKTKQNQAMNGASSGGGIHFNTNSYVLFYGTSYNAVDPKNFTVNLDGVSISTTFAGGNIFFSKITGDISGFVASQNTITVSNNSSEQKTISLNKYGVVTSN